MACGCGGGRLGQLPEIPALPADALCQPAVQAFECTWPTMQARLREEMKRERYVTFALAGAVVLSIVAAQKLLR